MEQILLVVPFGLLQTSGRFFADASKPCSLIFILQNLRLKAFCRIPKALLFVKAFIVGDKEVCAPLGFCHQRFMFVFIEKLFTNMK